MTAPIRVLLRSPDGRRVLARPNGLAGWSLPTVAARAGAEWHPEMDGLVWTEKLTTVAEAVLGGGVAPVRRVADDAWELEPLGRLRVPGTTWIGLDEVARLGADAALARDFLGPDATGAPGGRPDHDGARADPGRAGHLRPGWRGAVTAWATERCGAVGPATCIRHWDLAAVVRFPTASGSVVVKEPGPGFADEVPMVGDLSGLPHAPTVVAADEHRFALADAGATGVPAHEVAHALGRLQRAWVDQARRPAGRSLRAVVEVAGRDRRVGHALDRVAALGLADSVVHGDANRENALVDDRGSITIIDWTDTTLGCPAVDLDLLIGVGDSAADPAEVVPAWCRGFGTDPAPVLAALPAIRTVACALSVGLYSDARRHLRPEAHGYWDRWAGWWQGRLEAFLDAPDGGCD